MTLHDIALHCIALHCIALHYIVLHYSALHCITLHYTTLQCMLQPNPTCGILHCITLQYSAVHYMLQPNPTCGTYSPPPPPTPAAVALYFSYLRQQHRRHPSLFSSLSSLSRFRSSQNGTECRFVRRREFGVPPPSPLAAARRVTPPSPFVRSLLSLSSFPDEESDSSHM